MNQNFHLGVDLSNISYIYTKDSKKDTTKVSALFVLFVLSKEFIESFLYIKCYI